MAARRNNRVGFFAALGGALLLVVLIAGSPPQDGRPLDPRSSGELGARGLVLFLEEVGADVDVSADGPAEGDEIAVLLDDQLTEAVREDLFEWVEDGGTLVVTDPLSPISAPVDESSGGILGGLDGEVARGDCDIDALDGADDIDAQAPLLYEVTDDRSSCFGDDQSAFIVAEDVGAGRIISIGSPGPFINDQLDERDHAVIAGSLMAPQPGASVVVLEQPAPGDGEKSLSDLVSGGVKAAFVQVAIAFLIYALFRARRLGKPVAEPLPVPIAGSELVAAVGELLQQSGEPVRAARVMQDDTRRLLARRLGLTVDASPDLVADTVAARTRQARDHVFDLLTRSSISDESALVDLAQSLDVLRQEILHGQPR